MEGLAGAMAKDISFANAVRPESRQPRLLSKSIVRPEWIYTHVQTPRIPWVQGERRSAPRDTHKT